MVEFRLELLGPAAIRPRGGTRKAVPVSVQPVLAFLSLAKNTGCHREQLIDQLWPDIAPDRGRRRLNTVVWRARRLFGPERTGAIVVTRTGCINIDPAVVEIDIGPALQALSGERRAAAANGDPGAIHELTRAVRLDANRFVAGNYDDWVMQARHHLEIAVIKGLETLLEVASYPRDAIACAERLVQLDPLREDVHRRLMRLYAEAGRRADALRQYETCSRHLREDLGVEPLIETSLVAAAVREGLTPSPTNPADPRRALGTLREALASFRVLVDQIEATFEALPQD